MPQNNFLGDIHKQLQAEMSAMSNGAAVQFSMVKPPPAPPIPIHERVQNFLNMPIQQAQQMAVQMGPQAWKDYMDQNLNDVAETHGANAASQLAAMYQQATALPQTPDIMQTSLESELMQLIGHNGNGGPEPASSAAQPTGY